MNLTNTSIAGALTNSGAGAITAVNSGIRISGGALGSLLNSGSITTSGAGSAGILSSGVTYNGDVTNSGAIRSLATGLSLSGGRINGDVTNTATGTIVTTAASGANLGIGSSAVITGSLINDGQITGGGGAGAGRAGVSTSGGSIGGNLANNGTIGGYTTGVAVSTTAIAGAVTNGASGVVNATGVGLALSNATAGSLQNLGAITAVTQGVDVSGGAAGSLLNSGTIDTSGAGDENNGIYLRGGAGVAGDLVNSGRISGQAGAGAAKTTGVRLASATLGGALVNSGVITGYNYGVRLDSAPVTGSVTNSGAITSVDDGVLSTSSVSGGVQNLAGGAITAGGYGINLNDSGASYGGVLNAGTMTTVRSAIRANAVTLNGDVLNTGAITTTGTAATSNGIELQGATVTGSLANSGTMTGQAGTGGATTAGVLTSGGSIGGGVTNSGTISGYDYGLRMTTTPIAGALTNSGGITSVLDAIAVSGASIGGDVTNTSSGVIGAGDYGFNIVDFGAMGVFSNAGSLTAGNSAMRAANGTINGDVLNTGAITTTGTAATSNGIELQGATVTGSLANSGTMTGQAGTGGATTAGVLTSGGSIGGGVTNSGTVSGYDDGFSLSGTTVGGAIDNTGAVYAARYGFNLADAGTIGAFNNFGAIAAGVAGVRATGATQIQNMTNAQGVGNSAGPLTYSGVLPNNYFIVISGASYGQLAVDLNDHSGRTSFAISPLSTGVAPRNYLSVLTGVPIGDLSNPNSVQARFGDRGKLVLRQQQGNATNWDLRIEGLWNPYIGYNNPNVGSTYQALNANRMATEGVLHQRFAVLNAVMHYDCDRFDKYGLCLQFQTRQTGFGTQSTGAGVINASYRVADRFRVGGYLDYQAWARTPFGMTPATGGVQPDYDNATYGAYVGYAENDDRTGMQARMSGGHNSGRVNVVRAFFAGSEPGFGGARLNAFYLHGVVGYGVRLRDGMIVTPYAGLQYTGVTREAYMETFADTTIFPLTYNPYYERLITGLAGVKVSGMIDERLGYQAALGSQIDFSRNANAYGGVSVAPGLESFGLAHGGGWNGVRPSGMAGLSYAPLPNHRLSMNGYADQQAWTSRTYVTGLLGYQIGF